MRRFNFGRTRPYAILAAIACLAVVLAAVTSASTARKDVRSLPLLFATTKVPGSGFAEPSIAVGRNFHTYFCGPAGGLGAVPTGANGFIRTADWTRFTRNDINDGPDAGGDCDIKVGPDGSIYEADLALYDSVVRKAIDDGAAATSFNYQSWTEPIEEDRQWLAADQTDKNIVYYVYHDFAAEQEFALKSTDGGKTFLNRTLVSSDPNLVTDTMANTFSGPVRIDPKDHNVLAVVYGISTQADNVGACNAKQACFGFGKKIVVAVSTNGGSTFTDHVALNVSSMPGTFIGNLFPWVSWDQAGNLYAMAAESGGQPGKPTNGIFYAFSKDQGATWSPMIRVNTGPGAVVFPAVAAGKAGVADFTWIQSTTIDPNDSKGVWTIHFAQTRNALTTHPTFLQVTGKVVRHGAVCVLGTLCSGNRDLADFAELTLDPFGYAQAAFASTEGGLHVEWFRQDAGPSATSDPCPVAGRPGCVYTRPRPTS